jgi:ribonuclease P protein component
MGAGRQWGLPAPCPPSPGPIMRRYERLRRSEDFAAVYREGRAVSSDPLVLRARRNGLGVTRLGYAVGKRIGTAVVRNRVKRRLREAVRGFDLEPGWDVVIIARASAAMMDYHEGVRTLASLFRRAKLSRDRGKPGGAA